MKKDYKEGILGFNIDVNRYGLLISDLWEHEFHCGENLEVKTDDGKWVKTRMEMTPNLWVRIWNICLLE